MAPLLLAATQLPTLVELKLGPQNPAATPPISESIPIQPSLPESPPMAYHGADPAPFMPRGFTRQVVPGRQVSVRAFARRLLEEQNNDVAIVTFDDLPEGQRTWMQIRTMVGNFLTQHKRMIYRSIQPCHLGQAYVRLSSASDRDALIRGSPHPWEGEDFTFVSHDDGRNHRSLQFNHECWLMLLGFPLNYWHRENIELAIATFGRLLIWERDDTNLARIIIKVRVLSLPEVPRFIVVLDGEGFQGESWTV